MILHERTQLIMKKLSPIIQSIANKVHKEPNPSLYATNGFCCHVGLLLARVQDWWRRAMDLVPCVLCWQWIE
jgi:hypothetical protein